MFPQVRPTGALEYPNLDQAFFRLFGQIQTLKCDAKINVTQEGAKLQIETVTSPEVISRIFRITRSSFLCKEGFVE